MIYLTLRKMFLRFLKTRKSKRQITSFLNIGFHGDIYLLKFIDYLISDCDYFIETGTNVGSTLSYVALSYPKVQCLSCEPDKEAFKIAAKNTSNLQNVLLYNESSQRFLVSIQKDNEKVFENKQVLFWIDAHGYGFTWPLKDEISFITKNFKTGYIFIDDFKVPDMECFAHETYEGQVCSLDFVRDSLHPEHKYRVYYPNYSEKTSPHHSLVGWGLIEFGHENEIVVPPEIRNKIKGPLDV